MTITLIRRYMAQEAMSCNIVLASHYQSFVELETELEDLIL